jgi:putative acetyltransferase
MLRHIIKAANARGLSRLSLETGSWESFRPAREFYKRHGFRDTVWRLISSSQTASS